MSQTETRGVFRGLAPMLTNRTVIMTIAAAANDCFMVSIIPKKVKDDENDVLTTPLCVTGTAEELDRDLPGQIRAFVEVHTATASNIEQIKQELAAAEKTADEARKEKLRGKKTPPADKPAIPQKPEPQGTLGLFDVAESAEAVLSPTGDLAEVAP